MDIKLFGDRLLVPGSIEDLSNRIFKCSVVGANALRSAADKPVSRPAWLSIAFEFIFFYLTLAERRSWAHLPTEELEMLSSQAGDVLLTAVVDFVFEDADGADNAARVERFKDDLSKRKAEYGKYTLMVNDSEADKPEGTALWAFCSKVAALAGNPKDVGLLMTAHAHIYDSMFAVGVQG